MKIAQFYDKERLRLGLIEDNGLKPVDFQGDMIDFIRTKPDIKASDRPLPVDKVHFAPAVSRPPKIIGIGLNYLDHIQGSKGEIPKVPVVFAKFANSLLGHNERITWDTQLTKKVDFEAELAVIIGKTAYNCGESEAMETIFGYTCANDVSARDLQFGDGQWVRGKSLDTCQIMQNSNTGLMLFKLPQLISFLSKNFTLSPGDVILTGTPHGVGTFRNPSVYLKNGDEVVIEIEQVGRLVNTCQPL
jgi:2-keto-4-pentenoate hydratase/2-oxohepta-3-ene-1,7-dioic acid hydratase in catechol pathway